ncbi:asparagine synthase (glutamine-hydrolyzing) [Desulfoprunum benzoelyticum]|uniref:asparagine synthase (glutamine-hydrolyzing) n=1 Tax=Desulfoprunum benzoelyticum TaxID=1506996 RepID=A0A840ULV5_9BACT|nr:asparagine synthase (glutamine-hydrolyzing) [Desulfoprunum benzoelyticum]MBB5346585.1 asparagine synthase (glutamine-hydrolyzing) [Desulfoprunum benzoelyticum]MBM9528886.1 asparagine synthase (glutamine-hydrolyzing) [Desulfoprunum benzoelyticum]
MCGICGEVGRAYGYRVERALIGRMTDALSHRGPDDDGYHVHEMVGLGQRRLSIIDLSTGHQPIANEDQTIWVVLNGEIYNFQALREQLLQAGHRFSTNSDTEVIVHLYEEEGVDCLNRLRGMFAIALWDEKEKTLLLARDRLGKKPVFYAQLPQSLIFSSEVKSLLVDDRLGRHLNPLAVHDFLSFKFIPRQDDLIAGVHKLPPASYMIYRNGEATIRRYWQLQYATNTSMTEEEALAGTEQILSESVRLRMISDVPIGAFLSSGLDSGMIVALMSRMSPDPVNTFSIGDQTQGYNELPNARLIAEQCRTNHNELVVHPDAVKILPDLIWHLDGPYADVPALPMYYVAKLAREHVKVVLTGDGGDESFAGYDRYIANLLLAKYRSWLPGLIREKIVPAVLNLFKEKTERKSWRQSWRWFNTMSMLPDNECYARGISFFHFQNEDKELLYTDAFKAMVRGHNSLDGILSRFADDRVHDPVNKMTFSDLMIRVPEYSNIKIDRITMMHGLEARCPFLDHKLVEFAATIPTSIKIRHLRRKHLIKQLAKRYLPPKIVGLPKQGFGSPINTWLRGDLRGLAEGLLHNSKLVKDGLFRQDYIQTLLHQHASQQFNNGTRIWGLINVEIWYRINFGDRSPVEMKENIKDLFHAWQYGQAGKSKSWQL